MRAELQIGQRIKDNDPRMPPRVLTIIEVTPKEVLAENVAHRVFSIRPDRIYTDGKPRRTGFSLLPSAGVGIPQSNQEKP
jgi:hypothetical protein